MDERDMLKQIRQSAEQVDIPDALYPDAVEQRLREQQKNGGSKKASRFRRNVRRWGQLAAALALVVCAGAVFAVTQMVPHQELSNMSDAAPEAADQNGMSYNSAPEVHQEHSRIEEMGDMYHLADGYGEVYAMLGKQYLRDVVERFYGSFRYDSDMKEYENSSGADGAVGSPDPAVSGDVFFGEKNDFSDTNVVTEGVDEGDTVKTDGDYIYTIENDRIVITDIRDGALEKLTEIMPDQTAPADDFRELYVQKDVLLLVLQSTDSSMGAGRSESASMADTDDIYYWDPGECSTTVIAYDISDRRKPVEMGRMTQDGSYETSRRIGDTFYLFTYYNLEMPAVAPWNATRGEYLGEWLPMINGAVIGSDDIYLPEEGERGLVISSVDISDPGKTQDSLFIVDGGAEVYMAQDALYLYRSVYNGGSKTQIAAFALLEDGCIEPMGSNAVKGSVRDTFAINEHDGYLRVLTSDWTDGEDVNRLYILDQNMQLAGSIGGIAPGEEIYAARFFGDIGYFVTYRNTDPLFTVDLSDPRHPEIIGELKVTGFSEYLHFWDEEHLVGIGYETDPESGRREGVKLSMFNISDPANVTEEAKYVLSTEDYSNALYAYKEVLIAPGRNLIGFASESYEEDEVQYNVFSYEDGSFVPKLKEEIRSMYNSRGLYSGNTLYLVLGYDGIRSYDMDNGYTFVKERE